MRRLFWSAGERGVRSSDPQTPLPFLGNRSGPEKRREHGRDLAVLPGPTVSETKTFSDLGISPERLAAVEALGWTIPTPIQHQATGQCKPNNDSISEKQ